MKKRLKNKIATSDAVLSLYPIHEAIAILGKTGYDAIELWAQNLDVQLLNKKTSMDKIKSALEQAGMTGTIHAPLKNLFAKEPYKYNICSKNVRLRIESIQANLRAIDYTHKLGFNVITIHPGHTDSPEDKADNEYWNLQIDAFKRLALHAGEFGVKIGMEPMEHRPKEFVMEPAEVDLLIGTVASENLGITFDLIHAYSHGVDKPVEFLDKMHKNIFHVHMSGHSKEKNHVPFSMTIIDHQYLDGVLLKLVDKHTEIISIEGTMKGLVKETKKSQQEVVKSNLDYIHRELKALHLE
ncbi:MAG: sugar phosphate isomerase/epimerase family protein [Candidatus Woesearchaeota archaeon]